MPSLPTALLLLLPPLALAFTQGPHHLRDLYAYPKYQVQFLNDYPISESVAKLVREVGLGSQSEWEQLIPGGGKRLGDGPTEKLDLIPMNFSPKDADPSEAPHQYLCLMPSQNTTQSQLATLDQLEEVEDELDPAQGWAALSHLDGKCLYSKQGWFTYAYCHNSYIRQFRAAAHPHAHPTQGYVPQEDPNYEGYTLGRAQFDSSYERSQSKSSRSKVKGAKPGSPAHKAEKSVDSASGQTSTSPSVSFGHGASSRYLIQRWSDGTRCDKTSRPRSTELQVHCSMTSSDTIYMIKEVAICQYVMIIHSPHLCGLPGFRAREAEVGGAGVMCREVVGDHEWEEWKKERSLAGAVKSDKEAKSEGQQSFAAKPGKELPNLRFGLAAAREKPKADEASKDSAVPNKIKQGVTLEQVVFGVDKDDDITAALRKALDALAQETRGESVDEGQQGNEGEVLLLAWDEDEGGGAVLVEADMLVRDGEEEKKVGIKGGERELLQQILRQYLKDSEDDDEESEGEHRVRDEL
ncbi:hypothetical protein L202_03499 [Cryptococcus amylolentus CBS 6039]|uniref:Protein OS-9 homolog n=1 Tax=Cryptococcus amylolentus CBS 6039 TaxID=1295533 RepID=A0A1E3HT90_9TREE|nr:hypothetical protein L202_03499 [Cryptococcus amylolentus CBS 6039]ODN79542.1 hypothetical protein L202_03499 [Cryptococcus amylolentus CBS 6039]